MITLKTKKQVEQIRHNGQILRDAVEKAIQISKPGVPIYELDKVIEDHILKCGATPTFKGYGASSNRKSFPAASCCSPRDVLVHGIPSKKDILRDGDIISIDVGVTKNDCIADSCLSYGIGNVSEENRKLLQAARDITMHGISICKPNIRIFEITTQVHQKATELGYLPFPGLHGHGTGGTILHEAPSIPFNIDEIEGIPNPRLCEGMVITIEPVIGHISSQGKFREESDKWTLRTLDRSWTAQFEHTIYITSNGFEILTGIFPEQLVY